MIEEITGFKKSPLDALKAVSARRYPFFLDSACDKQKLGRNSFVGCDPFLVFRSKGRSVRLEWSDGKTESFDANPFAVLKGIFKRYKNSARAPDFPFTSGGVGYFSYDMKSLVEDLPDIAPDDLGLADCIMGFYDVVVIFDNLKNKCYISSSGMPELAPSKNLKRSAVRLKEFSGIISEPVKPASYTNPWFVIPESNFSKKSYIDAVIKAKGYIKAGDIYQVNLSQRFRVKFTERPIDLYERLRSLSPAPFSSFLDFKDLAVAGSSPERFLLKRGSYIETRPIKGTRPRGSNPADDIMMEQELLQSMKDRAEHIMIVDLERNDLGRICDYGTVKLSESMALERYSNVFHLVSTVSGTLKKGIEPVDCIEATFPGGSITGAPKIRSMEIIEELEPVKRSLYTGAIGYISFSGDMDMSITIRTMIIKGGEIIFSVGGGIVADSDPEAEYEETLHKAKGMFRALGGGESNK